MLKALKGRRYSTRWPTFSKPALNLPPVIMCSALAELLVSSRALPFSGSSLYVGNSEAGCIPR